MHTVTETTELTAEHIKAIRKADRVVFNHDPAKSNEGRAWAAKDNPKRDEPFEEYDFRFDLIVEPGIVTNYTGRREGGRLDPTSFSGSIEYGDLTVLRALAKKGDRLQGHWIVGNNNDHVTKAELRNDEFRVRIIRGNRVIEVLINTVTRPRYDRYCSM